MDVSGPDPGLSGTVASRRAPGQGTSAEPRASKSKTRYSPERSLICLQKRGSSISHTIKLTFITGYYYNATDDLVNFKLLLIVYM